MADRSVAESLAWPDSLDVRGVRGVPWSRLLPSDVRWGEHRDDPHVAGYTDGNYTVTVRVSAEDLARNSSPEARRDLLTAKLEQARVVAEHRLDLDQRACVRCMVELDR